MEYSCDEPFIPIGINDLTEKILKKYKKMDPFLGIVFDNIIENNDITYYSRNVSLRDIDIAKLYLDVLIKEQQSDSPRVFFKNRDTSKGLYIKFKRNYKYGSWYIYDSLKHDGIYIVNDILKISFKIK